MSQHLICQILHCYWNISILLEPTTSDVSVLVFHHAELFCMMMCSLEGFFMNHFYGNLFTTLTSCSLSLSLIYCVSLECETNIINHFKALSTASRENRQHAGQLISAASCTVKVLLKCHPAIHLFNVLQYNQPFIHAPFGGTP
jgi:hypothetical protein